ncbi:MAG: hypothetical protein HY882_14360 [Deltaproteobacteria bacterium]|nr:hypothetical protein [Deltaproteobacteria bacterium]
MGAILLIEDDRKVRGLIEKIFPQKDLKIFRALPHDQEAALESREGRSFKGVPRSALDEAVREYLKGGIDIGSDGHIHEYVIGKVEKALIGAVLEDEKGNQVRAAKRLGINRNTLRKKMKDLQIIPRVVVR